MPDQFAPQDPQTGFRSQLAALLGLGSQPGASSVPTMPAKQAGMGMDADAMRGALDALMSGLQGASNGVAQTVTLPIDSLAELLRAAGVPVQQPVLGDDWMRAHGLIGQPRNPVAGAVGEGLGLAAGGLLMPGVRAGKPFR